MTNPAYGINECTPLEILRAVQDASHMKLYGPSEHISGTFGSETCLVLGRWTIENHDWMCMDGITNLLWSVSKGFVWHDEPNVRNENEKFCIDNLLTDTVLRVIQKKIMNKANRRQIGEIRKFFDSMVSVDKILDGYAEQPYKTDILFYYAFYLNDEPWGCMATRRGNSKIYYKLLELCGNEYMIRYEPGHTLFIGGDEFTGVYRSIAYGLLGIEDTE